MEIGFFEYMEEFYEDYIRSCEENRIPEESRLSKKDYFKLENELTTLSSLELKTGYLLKDQYQRKKELEEKLMMKVNLNWKNKEKERIIKRFFERVKEKDSNYTEIKEEITFSKEKN